MNGLALDASTTRAAVALGRRDGAEWAAPDDGGVRHGRRLVASVRDLLEAAGLRVGDLDAIGVGLGPGSYTGLRVAVTAAKALAYASGARLVGLDSPEFFARAAPEGASSVAVLSDAQRGDFHLAEFLRDRAGSPPVRRGPTRIVPGEHLGEIIEANAAVVGPGAARWDDPRVLPDVRPGPLLLLDMLREAVAEGRSEDPWLLEPLYLRRSAAEDQWGRTP